MTACTNNGGSRARRAVTAALVGVLSVGAAPMVALATGAAPASGDVSLQAVSDEHDAFMAGTVAEYTVGGDKYDGSESVTLKKSELEKNVILITSVQPSGEGLDAVDYKGTTFYYKKATGTTENAIKINDSWYTSAGYDAASFKDLSVGEYIAVAKYDNQQDSFEYGESYTAPAVSFTVTSDSLEGARLMKDLGNGEYTDELTYEYGVKWNNLKVVLDGDEFGDATAEVYAQGQAGDDLVASGSGIQPGTYEVVIKGNDDTDYENDEETYTLTVSKLNLSSLNLYINDVKDGEDAPKIAEIKGDDADKLGSYLSSEYMDLQIDKTWGTSGVGQYTMTLSVKDTDAAAAAADRIEGELELTFNRVNADAAKATWHYDEEHSFTDGKEIVVDSSYEKDDYSSPTWTLKSFDLSNFTGIYTDEDGEQASFGSESYTATIRDANGNVVDSMDKKGVYKVTLEADSSDFDWSVQRSPITFTVTYKQGTIGTAGTTFSFDGDVVKDTLRVTFDGQDYLSRIGIQVKDTNGNVLAEGEDYEVKVTKDGKEVDSIVDAGTYTVTVSSDTYEFDGDVDETNSIKVVVSAFELSDDNTRVVFKNAITYTETYWDDTDDAFKTRDVTFVPYSDGGSVPVIEVALTEDEDGEPVWSELDSALYKLEYKFSKEYSATPSKEVDSVKEIGYYTVGVSIDSRKTGNFEGSLTSELWRVGDEKVFVDVPNTAYYAQAIYTAVNQGYIVGLGGSNMFGPDQSISRADMVCVLYRMAGGSVDSEGVSNADEAYISDFEDVDPNAYYAKAVAWAVKAGVANGYGDTFGTERNVSTEEFVTMLARYAAICGTDTSVDDVDAVLAGTPDGDQVSGYAREAMAWAVESEYVGKDGNSLVPQGSVSRGRAVTIAVRYQPAQNDVVSRL